MTSPTSFRVQSLLVAALAFAMNLGCRRPMRNPATR